LSSKTDGAFRVSVVIPVLNAGGYLEELFDTILSQEPTVPDEIILVDSNSTDNTREIAARYDCVRVLPIENFSHGRARNMGARETRGDVVVLLTQDALPQGNDWLGTLLAPLTDDTVAATFSRQVPRPDANPMERYYLARQFSGGSPVRRQKRGKKLRFPDVFFSNVSAAIRRDLLLRFPFDENLIMTEDQQFARDVLEAGYATVYEPASVVRHSHNYPLRDIFRRYFDSAYSFSVILPHLGVLDHMQVGSGTLLREMAHMIRRHPLVLPHYVCHVVVRSCGSMLGYWAEKMPRPLAERMSLHSYHWNSGPPADSGPGCAEPQGEKGRSDP